MALIGVDLRAPVMILDISMGIKGFWIHLIMSNSTNIHMNLLHFHEVSYVVKIWHIHSAFVIQVDEMTK